MARKGDSSTGMLATQLYTYQFIPALTNMLLIPGGKQHLINPTLQKWLTKKVVVAKVVTTKDVAFVATISKATPAVGGGKQKKTKVLHPPKNKRGPDEFVAEALKKPKVGPNNPASSTSKAWAPSLKENKSNPILATAKAFIDHVLYAQIN